MGSIEEGRRLFAAKRYDLALAELLLAEEEAGDRMELAYYMGLCLPTLERYDDALLYL